MIGFWRQLRFLLWKGFLIKRRQKIWLAIELLFPLILFAILALVRTRDFTDARTQCHYDSKGLPSAGLLPFLHSFLCSFSNTCHLSPSTGDEMDYINNGTAGQESILVDMIYYSSLQLEQIGSNPAKFSALIQEAVHLIQIIAAVNSTNIPHMTIQDFFVPSFDIPSHLVQFGLTLPMATVIANSPVTPYCVMETYSYVNSLRSMSTFDLMFSASDGAPMLCNQEMFNKCFILPENWKSNLTSADISSLCSVTPLNLMDAEVAPFLQNFNSNPNVSLPLQNGSTYSMGSMISSVENFRDLSADQPLWTFANKWASFLKNSTKIKDALFCGSDPFKTSTGGLVPSNTGAATPFDKMKRDLIDFIQKVIPGQDTPDKQFCQNISIVTNGNCSSIETALVRKLRPLFQGYILVSPKSPIVDELVDKLNQPLRQFDFFRRQLYEYPEIADAIQTGLHGSLLYQASQNALAYLKLSFPGSTQPIIQEMEFMLEHIFAPSSDPDSFGAITKNLTEMINQYSQCFRADRFVVVESESDMEEVAMCLSQYEQYFSGIAFMNLSANSTQFPDFATYKIRHNPDMVDTTNGIGDSPSRVFSRDQPFNDLKYLTYGFSYLQEAIDRALITLSTNQSVPVGAYAQQEPYPCAQRDNFNMSNFLGLFVVLSFIIPAALLVKNIVYEKEQRLKEQMRIMGLGDTVHFVSWAIISFILNFTSVVIMSLILKYGRLFDNTDLTLIIVFLTLFAISSISMSLLLSTFFSNANISTAATCIICFFFFFPYQLSSKAKSKGFAHFTLIFPQTTLGYGCFMLAQANELQTATWATINQIYLDAYDVSFTSCLVALALQSITFCLLAWYISAIAPGVYGVSQPFYFFLTRQYWMPMSVPEIMDSSPAFDPIPGELNDHFEPEPQEQRMTVHINHMSKIYASGTKALDNLNLRLYEGQITALLGHNGAGKTTTMSILCGLYSPSSGTASVYGRDIRKNLRRVRDVLGVCPQYNVLFSLLTVSEQLRFFAALKGTKDEDLDSEVQNILNSVSLSDKAAALVSTLSGGMKRRLCIGIALIGGSRFVILDEPTAGVDVTSRKEIWTLLQNNKKDRTILLSTHHMDEADVLSDRIAILSEGKLISLGSSVFLKNKFGNSFQLIVCKEERGADYKDTIAKILKESPVKMKIVDETEEEVVFSIPILTDSSILEEFFTDFDERRGKYRVKDYGISAPTLQQIFVRLTPQREYHIPRDNSSICTKIGKIFRRKTPIDTEQTVLIRDPNASAVITMQNGGSDETKSDEKEDYDFDPPVLEPSGLKRTWGHIYALMACRWHYMMRSKKTTLFEVILPIFLLLGCEIYALLANGNTRVAVVFSQPALPLIQGLFGNQTDTYVNVWDRTPSSYSYQIMNSIVNAPGMGIRCTEGYPALWEYLHKMERKLDKNNMPERKFHMDTVNGCAYGTSAGSFDWNTNRTTVPYNEDLICACTDNIGWNCTADDYPLYSLDQLTLNTTDRIWDMSYRNLSQMRMATRWTTNQSDDAPFFLGGYSLGHINLRAKSADEIVIEKNGWMVFKTGMSSFASQIGVNISVPSWQPIEDPFITNITVDSFVFSLLENLDTQQNVKVWFNNKMWPTLPIYASELSDALLRIASSGKIDASQLGILTYNQPMNKTVKGAFDSNAIQKLLIFRINIIVLVLCVIPAGFTVFLVEDRICDSYHLQLVSGLTKKCYWITGYVFDMTVYTVSTIAILLIYVVFSVKEFSYDFGTLGSFFLLFTLYGLCAVLWAYVLQRYFSIPALSFVIIAIGTFFVGIVCAFTVIMIEQLMQTDPTLEPSHTVCSYVFLILPQYNLAMAIFRGSFIYQLVQMGQNYLIDLNRPDLIDSLPIPSILSWSLMGKHCLILFIQTLIGALLLIITEHGSIASFRRIEKRYTARLLSKDDKREDEDVEAEQRRVDTTYSSGQSASYPLVVHRLAKAYSSSHLAVRGVSFAVEKGECFGLLGLNGAGKTTTFGILTAKTHAGSGKVAVHGFPVSRGDSSGFNQLGYCPQFDALNMKLTAKENLVFFSRIRGVPEKDIEQLTNRLLLALHLRPYSSTLTASLSGGNRRKLSVAIALVSQPSLVLLDEPSAGMDPGSQQFLWKVIEKLRRSGKAVVMTSHSMEECEALCTRIAIMDKGKIRCIGSKQHLKNKFGEGYSLTIKTASYSVAKAAAAFILPRIQDAKLEAIHCSTVFIHMKRESTTIAHVFHVVNLLKAEMDIEDFSLSQSTLDEVFHSLATREWAPSQSSETSSTRDIMLATTTTTSTNLSGEEDESDEKDSEEEPDVPEDAHSTRALTPR